LFICLIAILENRIAKRRIWWWYYQKPFQKIPGGLAYIPIKFILSVLTLRFTYGKFIKYLTSDTLFNYLYAFPINTWYKKKGLVSFVRISPFNYFELLSIKSLMLYGIQIVIDRSPKYMAYFYKLVKSKQIAKDHQ